MAPSGSSSSCDTSEQNGPVGEEAEHLAEETAAPGTMASSRTIPAR